MSTIQPAPGILAAIDIGTVSTRLIVAAADSRTPAPLEAREPLRNALPVTLGAVLERDAVITDLGEGVDATGALTNAAIERTVRTVAAYVERIRARAAAASTTALVATTTTSAARDAANARELLDPLQALGVAPQVIEGATEASLALLGVTADFGTAPVLVADIGGGSTELTVGRRRDDGTLVRESCASYNVGCRRVAERFELAQGPASPEAAAAARAFIASELEEALANRPPQTRLVCVGGTATSLVAVAHELVPYDSSFVHLHTMDRAAVHALAQRLLALPLDQRAQLPGLQPKRAAVIGAGALILDELMALGGFESYTASESDSLQGLLGCLTAVRDGVDAPFGWVPRTAVMG